MTTPDVSIIVPCYNGHAFLPQAGGRWPVTGGR